MLFYTERVNTLSCIYSFDTTNPIFFTYHKSNCWIIYIRQFWLEMREAHPYFFLVIIWVIKKKKIYCYFPYDKAHRYIELATWKFLCKFCNLDFCVSVQSISLLLGLASFCCMLSSAQMHTENYITADTTIGTLRGKQFFIENSLVDGFFGEWFQSRIVIILWTTGV